MNTDVIISTRIRLARNLAEFNFPELIFNTPQELTIVNKVFGVLERIGRFDYYKMNKLTKVQKASFVERYVISSRLAVSPQGAVALSDDGLLSVMVNEEDHIREQCMVKGFDFEGCLQRITKLDRILGSNCAFAARNGFHYTACPTNLGTGMRASLMLFLPMLTKNGRITEIQEQANAQGITIRGALGEGSSADGYYYQVSNAVTIGNAQQLIKNVQDFALLICDEENELRQQQYSVAPAQTKDTCLRALGVLTHAAVLPYAEFCELISRVKLGISLGFIYCLNSEQIDDLTVTARTNTLKLNLGGDKPYDEDEQRAVYIKNALRALGCAEA